jgi:AP-3 complex subunit delta
LIGENPKVGGICEVLYAAAYIVGEFGADAEDKVQIIDAMLQPQAALLPGHIQSIYVHNALKLLAHIGQRESNAEFRKALKITEEQLPVFTQSMHLEVQERACFSLEMVKLVSSLIDSQPDVVTELAALFADPLNPVAPRAQKKVPVPEGLDLDQQINVEPVIEDADDADDDPNDIWGHHNDSDSSSSDKNRRRRDRRDHHAGEGASAERRRERKKTQSLNPFYLGGDSPLPRELSSDEDDYPLEHLTPDMLVGDSPLPGETAAARRPPVRRSRPTKRSRAVVLTQDEMPEGMNDRDSGDERSAAKDELSSIDLTSDLRPDEMLTTRAYPMPGSYPDKDIKAAQNPFNKQQAPAASDDRADRKHRSRRDRDRKDRDRKDRDRKDRDRKDRDHKDRRDDKDRRRTDKDDKRSSSAAPSSAKPSGASLLDLGGASASSSNRPQTVPANAPSLLDMDFAPASPAPVTTPPVSSPSSYSVLESPQVPPASASRDSAPSVASASADRDRDRDRDRSSRSDRDRDRDRSSRSDRDRDRKSSRSHRDDDRRSSRHDDRHHSSSSSEPLAGKNSDIAIVCPPISRHTFWPPHSVATDSPPQYHDALLSLLRCRPTACVSTPPSPTKC